MGRARRQGLRSQVLPAARSTRIATAKKRTVADPRSAFWRRFWPWFGPERRGMAPKAGGHPPRRGTVPAPWKNSVHCPPPPPFPPSRPKSLLGRRSRPWGGFRRFKGNSSDRVSAFVGGRSPFPRPRRGGRGLSPWRRATPGIAALFFAKPAEHVRGVWGPVGVGDRGLKRE